MYSHYQLHSLILLVLITTLTPFTAYRLCNERTHRFPCLVCFSIPENIDMEYSYGLDPIQHADYPFLESNLQLSHTYTLQCYHYSPPARPFPTEWKLLMSRFRRRIPCFWHAWIRAGPGPSLRKKSSWLLKSLNISRWRGHMPQPHHVCHPISANTSPNIVIDWNTCSISRPRNVFIGRARAY